MAAVATQVFRVIKVIRAVELLSVGLVLKAIKVMELSGLELLGCNSNILE